MSNVLRNVAYSFLVALAGATFAACGGSSGGGDAGEDARADGPAADIATDHGDAADAQSNDSQTSDAAPDGGSDGASTGAVDGAPDAAADGASDGASTGAPGSDAAADDDVKDASSDSSDTSGDNPPDAANDSSVAAEAGTDGATCGTTDTPDNCGTCGMVCPGYLKPHDNVTCMGGTACTFSCQGENYDVDGQLANGCEATDLPSGNHSQPTAAYGGSFPCTDASSNPNIHGTLLSDGRGHATPAIAGFDDLTGSAADWIVLTASGGAFCSDDLMLTLQVMGSSRPDCYQLTVITNKLTLSGATSAGGTAVISQASAYSDNTVIYVSVSKTCSVALTENVSYSVTGHL